MTKNKLFFKCLTVCFVLLITLSNAYAQRPLIGITTVFTENQIRLNYDYITAIEDNGGIAIVLPPTSDERIIAKYAAMVDGMIFSGGLDIPPGYYLQEPHPETGTMDDIRFNFEHRMIHTFYNTGKPIFGICLGMQFTNVVLGGSMIQDIPDLIGEQVIHRDGQMYTNFHPVGIAVNSELYKILGARTINVLSRHHQAVDIIGATLRPVAWSADGVIEALERTDGPFGIFVQWHPESMLHADIEHRDALFRAFIDACH